MSGQSDIQSHIQGVLGEVASCDGVRILYAAESGSRAWGFGSPDSDFDVRFIYAHPPEWYLRLAEGRDVIERPLDDRLVDLAGWDVRKTLRLLLKSNPVLYEWLSSPIVYADDGAFRPAAMALFERHASRTALAHHYHSIAKGQWRSQIDGRDQVRLKKYFYIIRPLLSLSWVATHDGPPPMALDALLAAADLAPAIRAAINALTVKKRDTPEMGLEPRLADIDGWAHVELARLDPARLDPADAPRSDTPAEADQLFQRVIGFGGAPRETSGGSLRLTSLNADLTRPAGCP